MRRRIIVALSGGVDSAVSAALLQRRGFAVEGVYLKYASEITRGFLDTEHCSWQEDWEAVQAVGRQLRIPVRSQNVEREYNDVVIRNFLHEYSQGRTPNPDVLCNRAIKFGVLFRLAMSRGARALATGHYARIMHRAGHYQLWQGRDHEKDQSYFLYGIPGNRLSMVKFPIGGMKKSYVRQLAQRWRLPNADRPDSQGICFLGPMRVAEFLRQHIPVEPGPVETSDGLELGRHHGWQLYTIGQRHGLGVASSQPLYVARKIPERRALVVARGRDEAVLFTRHCQTEPAHWLPGAPAASSFRAHVRIRYRQPLQSASIVVTPVGLNVAFDQPVRAIAPGQSLVCYDGNRVLGGAVIRQTEGAAL